MGAIKAPNPPHTSFPPPPHQYALSHPRPSNTNTQPPCISVPHGNSPPTEATMLQLVAAVRRKILKLTTKRVIDESSLGGNGQDHPDHDDEAAAAAARDGGPILYRILRAPVSLLGCISAHHINGVDGASASYSYEVNYLMVRDSMRYAIYV